MAAAVERGSGNGHDLAPHFSSQSRSDERAGLRCSLHHQSSCRHPGDDPVAAGKVAGKRFGSRRLFGNQQPLNRDLFLKFGVFRRIRDVNPAGDHAYSRSAGSTSRQGAAMRRAVYSARQTGDYGKASLCQPRPEVPRQFDRGRRSIARPDNRHAGPRSKRSITSHDQHRRSAFRLGKKCGIVRRIVKKVTRARPLHRGYFRLDPVCRYRSIGCPSTRSEVRQGLQRGNGTAEAS